MSTVKKFDLNRVPDSQSSSEDSNRKGEQTIHHEEEDFTKFSSIESKNTQLIQGPQEDHPNTVQSVWLEIIENLKRRSKGFREDRKASTTAIIELAIQNFTQPCSRTVDGFSFADFSDEDIRDAKLVKILLASAEKAGERQFEKASELIKQCSALSSKTGTPVQRLVHYFSYALHEKIKKEAGGNKSPCNYSGPWDMFDLREALLNTYSSIITFYLKSPLPQFCSFIGVQIIAEHMREARKVHIIGFEIFTRLRFIILMQDLATSSDQSLEHLKITVVAKSNLQIEDTDKQLASFAESLNLSFTFKVVMVEDLQELSIDLFELDDQEQVAVYSPFILSMLIAHPVRLHSLMRMIKEINPCVTVISEVEANHASPIFINRFMESLVFLSAIFDNVAECMGGDEQNRIAMESLYFELRIGNILAPEGVEIAIRHQNIDMWRELFARYGMVESELTVASQDHANVLLRTLEHGSSCTLDMDGKCFILGWKGVPIFSVSVWKFQ